MFSSRVPADLAVNRLSRAVADAYAGGRPLIDLTLSNPTRAGFEYPDYLLSALADERGLKYEPSPFGLVSARQAVARDYARRGLTVSSDRIALTASTSEAYSLLFKLLADAGDDVLVPVPSYPLFDHLAQLDGVVLRRYELEYQNGWSIDVGSIERALSPSTRALLLVTPNNPTGSFVSRAELKQLQAICAQRNIALVADEVFADYQVRPGACVDAARVLDATDGLVFSLGGLSKTVGLPQIKLGWVAVAGASGLVDEALRRLELICDTYLSVSTPVQAALSELLTRGAAVRKQIQARIASNYRTLADRIEGVPSCSLLVADGGWSAIIRVPSIGTEEDLVVDLVGKGVLVHPGYFFDLPHESFLVVSLLPAEDQFSDGIDIVLRHFRNL
ncbi:MAG TPA: pyridoxal phosphate-dependent aminotransferase [Vicinamibacterales bacterium]|nr:pyridoxal phosphate-dependent aminotransferase [Vicinamibacterales bacterium]